MVIEMNEDIEKYEETVVMGLTARQAIFSFLSLMVGAGIILFLYFCVGIGIMVSCYIAIPFVMPIALMGFYKYNGMNFFQFFSRFIASFRLSKPLLYQSTENMKEYEKLMIQPEDKKKIRQVKEKKVQKKMNKKKFLGTFLVILVLAVLVLGVYEYRKYGIIRGVAIQEIFDWVCLTVEGIINGCKI